MANVIIFFTMLAILIFTTSEALAIYIATRKRISNKVAIPLGLLPIIGQIILANMRVQDQVILDEMYQRDLINTDDFTKTMEVIKNRDDKKGKLSLETQTTFIPNRKRKKKKEK